MTDGYVKIGSDPGNKSADTSELTRSDGTVVERQRMVIGDPLMFSSLASVTPDGSLSVDLGETGTFSLILSELRRIATILETIAGVHIPAEDLN